MTLKHMNNEEAAFPISAAPNSGLVQSRTHLGLTKREWYFGMILSQMARPHFFQEECRAAMDERCKVVAEAWIYADLAMDRATKWEKEEG